MRMTQNLTMKDGLVQLQAKAWFERLKVDTPSAQAIFDVVRTNNYGLEKEKAEAIASATSSWRATVLFVRTELGRKSAM
jgi:hypothetical protein